MKRTNEALLVGIAGLMSAISLLVVQRAYHMLPPVPVGVVLLLWFGAVICVVLAYIVRQSLKENNIGLDRTQLTPTRAFAYLVVGRASAWTGAVIGGVYLGLAVYVLPRAGDLSAAADDLPVVMGALIGGISLSVAGLWLEYNCLVPPQPEGEQVG